VCLLLGQNLNGVLAWALPCAISWRRRRREWLGNLARLPTARLHRRAPPRAGSRHTSGPHRRCLHLWIRRLDDVVLVRAWAPLPWPSPKCPAASRSGSPVKTYRPGAALRQENRVDPGAPVHASCAGSPCIAGVLSVVAARHGDSMSPNPRLANAPAGASASAAVISAQPQVELRRGGAENRFATGPGVAADSLDVDVDGHQQLERLVQLTSRTQRSTPSNCFAEFSLRRRAAARSCRSSGDSGGLVGEAVDRGSLPSETRASRAPAPVPGGLSTRLCCLSGCRPGPRPQRSPDATSSHSITPWRRA